MNRRQIHHVEAHLRDVGQPLLTIRKCAVLPNLLRGRAGKELVPRTESRNHRIDDNDVFAARLGGEALVRILQHQIVELLVCGQAPAAMLLPTPARVRQPQPPDRLQ